MKLTIIIKDQFELVYFFDVQVIKQHTLRHSINYLFPICLISLLQEQTTLEIAIP